LVIDISTSYSDTRTTSNVKTICVVTKGASVSSRVVNCHVGDGQTTSTINTDGLDWCVLDVQIGDGGVDKIVGIEELRFGHAAVTTKPIPIRGTVTIQIGARCAYNSDACALNLKQRTRPRLVSPRCLAFEDDLTILAKLQVHRYSKFTYSRVVWKTREIQSGAGRHSDAR
jgi:hypothetical protein